MQRTADLLWLNYIARHGVGLRLGLKSYLFIAVGSWDCNLNSKSMQCENFCLVQCSHRVWNLNLNPQSLYPSRK